MSISEGARSVVLCFAAALLARCGTSLPSGNGGVPASADASARSRSWMSPAAKDRDLLYLSDVRSNAVGVYELPSARQIGTIASLGRPRAECADTSGNVWIADDGADQIVEYAHGGTQAIAALSTPGEPGGCSVDPVTGNLAVTSGPIVAVYERSRRGIWRDPLQYRFPPLHAADYCGYDSGGNLFVDGSTKSGAFRLAELPRHGNDLVGITLRRNIRVPGQVQWDGVHLAIGDAGATPPVIYRFSVSGRAAMEAGSTTLRRARSVRQFWIDGDAVAASDFNRDAGLWSYPKGGGPITRISGVHGYGAAISIPTASPSPTPRGER